jgi:hypothetical protein
VYRVAVPCCVRDLQPLSDYETVVESFRPAAGHLTRYSSGFDLSSFMGGGMAHVPYLESEGHCRLSEIGSCEASILPSLVMIVGADPHSGSGRVCR